MSSKSGRQSAAARAAEVRQETLRREQRRRWLIVGGVFVVLTAVILGVYKLMDVADTSDVVADTVPAGYTDDYGIVVGDPKAPKTVTIYEDFQCPICREFEEATGDDLAAGIEAGRVKVEYRVVSFLDRFSGNEFSSRAANAGAAVADAAGPEAWKKFHDLVFANQPEEGTDGPDNEQLIAWAVEAGADEDAVRANIESGAFDQWVVNATDAMSKNDVTGTPTSFVDGERTDENLATAIDQVLAAAK